MEHARDQAVTTEEETPEHPEDKAAREEGEKYGRQHAKAFAADFDLAALIGTYADEEAHTLLDALREKFWARVWQPK